MDTPKRAKALNEFLVGAMVPKSLVMMLDHEAEQECTTRSHVLRRILMQHYQARSSQLLHEVMRAS